MSFRFSGGWASVPGSLEGMIASVLSYQLLSWTNFLLGRGCGMGATCLRGGDGVEWMGLWRGLWLRLGFMWLFCGMDVIVRCGGGK